MDSKNYAITAERMPSKGLARFFPQTGHRSVQVKEPVEDTIHLRNLRVSATIGRDAWGRASRAQPIITSLQLHVDTTSAGNSDNLKDTLSYGQMYREVIGKADRASFESIDDLASSLGELFNNWPGKRVELQVLAPKASLRAEGGLTKECSWELGHSWKQCTLISHAWTIRGLKLACIIGVNPHERFEKQIVNIDLQIEGEITTAQYEAQLMGSGTAWTLLVNRICKVSFGATESDITYLFPPRGCGSFFLRNLGSPL